MAKLLRRIVARWYIFVIVVFVGTFLNPPTITGVTYSVLSGAGCVACSVMANYILDYLGINQL